MRPKSLILLALALSCGLVASIGISQVMESRGEPAAPEETQLVLVAMTRIDRNTELSAQNIRLDEMPVGKIPPDALTSLEEVEGRRPGAVIYAGSIVLGPMLGSGESVRAASQIPEGMRSVSVRVDNTSGAGLIRPGDRVDVQLYARRNPSAGIMETGTHTILQDVSVFAVNAIISDDENNEALAAKTISLLVTPEQSAKVNLASEVGTIRLVMRGLTDKTEAETFNIGIPDLLGQTEKLGEKESSNNKSDATNGDITQPGSGDIADFLNQQAAQPQPEPAPVAQPQVVAAPPVDRWKMRIFSGTNVRVDLFEDDQPLHLSGATSNQAAPNQAADNDPKRLPAIEEPADPAPEPVVDEIDLDTDVENEIDLEGDDLTVDSTVDSTVDGPALSP